MNILFSNKVVRLDFLAKLVQGVANTVATVLIHREYASEVVTLVLKDTSVRIMHEVSFWLFFFLVHHIQNLICSRSVSVSTVEIS